MKTTLQLLVLFLLMIPASAKAIHDDPGGVKCLDCHVTLPFDRENLSYTEKVGDICRACHGKYPCNNKGDHNDFAHPIGVKPGMKMKIPVDMPLDLKGRLTCITCHSYHAEFWDAEYNSKFLLRRPQGKKLCSSCHKNFPHL